MSPDKAVRSGASFHWPPCLWSLWDMLDNYASAFFSVGTYLASAHFRIQRWREENPDKPIITGDNPAHDDALHGLKWAHLICRRYRLPLGTLTEEIETAISLNTDEAIADRFEYDIEKIKERFGRELKNHRFKYVLPELVSFYGQKEPFGPVVAKRFPDASEDLENSGSCLALEQPTACVFHLMRAMEVAVQAMGKHLGMTINPKNTWGQIVSYIDPKIRAMPDNTAARKRKKDAWSAATAHLHHVRQAWRNSTMHPKKTYTQNEAREVYAAVQAFMTAIAKL